jgi:hypothetical protein
MMTARLKTLWQQSPLNREAERLTYLTREIGSYRLVPLVTTGPDCRTHAELDILMLRPAPPGDLLNHAGDLDNRIKPLLDARMPCHPHELPDGIEPGHGEQPFFVLLEDDALVTRIGVTTDRLLTPGRPTGEADLIIGVTIRRA